PEGGRLLFEQGLQGAFGEAGGGGLRDLLHGVEIDIESGAVRAEGAAGDHFAPRAGGLLRLLGFVGGALAACDGAPCLRVNAKPNGRLTPDDIRSTTSSGKAVHDLRHRSRLPAPLAEASTILSNALESLDRVAEVSEA